MPYVDGYVLAVPIANRAAYEALALISAPLFKEHGALRVVECWGDDVPDGKLTSFPMAVKLEPEETVVFSWIIWPDKAARDSGMAAAMKDPRMDFNNMPQPIPFDGKRMIFGGFQMFLDM
jgi:uncharacterized protein YbaA (DUF1428 family)